MGLLDLFKKKKKKISVKSANFARLVKYLCSQSGIPIETQLNITKAIAKDFIDKPGVGIERFVFMDPTQAKAYLVSHGMSQLDADIFWSIIQENRESFLTI